MQFLGTTIPPVCVCHSINSKKCTQARNRHHNQDIQHSHHPQKFLHSSWQAFPLHDSQPLSVTDLYSFTFSRLPYKQNYGVCCILCLSLYLAQSTGDQSHCCMYQDLVLPLLSSIRCVAPHLFMPQMMNLEWFPVWVIVNKYSYTSFGTGICFHLSCSKYLGVRSLGHMEIMFIRNCHTVPHCVSPPRLCKSSSYSYHYQELTLSGNFMILVI